MITDEHIMEGLSLAYITAVAHMTGMDCAYTKFDYGIDGTFSDVKIRPNGRRNTNGFKIDFQLKSTTNIIVKPNEISYKLEAKNYNDLVETDIGTPRILIVFHMPSDKNHWLNLSESELVLKHCAWWTCLHGQAASTNKSNRTIKIPRKQLFNVGSLQELMTRHREGKFYDSI